jgi:hypothetical protein
VLKKELVQHLRTKRRTRRSRHSWHHYLGSRRTRKENSTCPCSSRPDGYVKVAGALIGLQFVVITLGAERPPEDAEAAGAAFASPTIVHFGVVLFLSALLLAPWQTIAVVAVVWGVLGFGGVAYTVIVARRMRKQAAYKPEFEDWSFHVVLPLAAYAILAVSSFAAPSHTRAALFCVGCAALLLLFTGIHNAWDNIAYHVLVTKANTNTARRGDEGK